MLANHIRYIHSTAIRIFRQLLHDPRTLLLLFLMPCLLLGLFRWMYQDNDRIFNQIAPSLLGIFPLTIMFLITSITTLRERSGGTLERLMALPIGKFDFIAGYLIAFGVIASIQALLASTVMLYGLGLDIKGPEWFLLLTAISDSLLGTALGLFLSAFAKSEFQAVQFFPAFILPQFLVCGLLMPVDKMPELLGQIARVLPLTYAVDALQGITANSTITNDMQTDVLIVLAFAFGAIILATLSLRRHTK